VSCDLVVYVHTNLHLIYKLEPITFDDGDPLEGSSSKSTSTNVRIALDIGEEEEDEGESSGSDANLDDYDMEDY
jgi:hypothetical protein